MLKSFFNYVTALKGRLPLIYSLVLITFIPLTLVVNTWWNLHSFERDMDFAVRDKALTIQKAFIVQLQNESLTETIVKQTIDTFTALEPTITHISVLEAKTDGAFKVLSTSDYSHASQDEAVLLNQMAWSQNESFFTKTYDSVSKQNLWMVISPLYDREQKKVGLVNFKVSSEAVDVVVNRTTRDALLILGLSVLGVVLLLINHLRFFEQSLLVEKLQQFDKMKDDFISVASHELRTPLTAIKSGVSLIKEDFKETIPAQMNEWFSIIDVSVARLNDLVSDLLNVSRIEQNRIDFSLNSVDSTNLIQETIEQLKFTAQEKGLSLSAQLPDTPCTVVANHDRLQEVLVNLIGNAIKYTPQGSVTIKQVVDGKTVKILVQDTGLGIAPEDKEKLFLKFSRISTDQTKEIPGTGLGLWITKSLVERMKGKIYVDSIVGQGTVFTVVLQKAQTKA